MYPTHREADVALRDGSTVHVRPVRAEDRAQILAFLRALSQRSLYFRFFTGGTNLERAADWATDVDYHDRYGIVATSGASGGIVAHASFTRTGDDRAELGIEIADPLQGHGLGTILLAHLAEAARDAGIGTLAGVVLPENAKMIEVFRESGFPVEARSTAGEIRFEFPTSLTPEGIQRFERREQIAAIAAMRAFLQPRGVAVIGASNRRGSIGGETFRNLIAAGFNGPVYPVHPKDEAVQSVLAYPSVAAIPGVVDLAVIIVPAASVIDVARGCGEKGVRSLVVISAGFGEVGAAGLERQRELLAVCRAWGMRLIGPNCMGIMNVAPDVRLNATFSPIWPPHGGVGFLSQSGALGLAVIDHARRLGLGLSSFVSVGNKADISGNDLIHWWDADEDTDLILLYLESFGNPRRFSRVARAVARRKPIVAVKSGRSAAGARAASSHTGALLAASDVTVDALFRQAGVIRTDTLSEMFDVATLLANQPLPTGRRVAIVTNAGGPAILCADACEAAGLQVVPLPAEVRGALRAALPADAAVGNPVDMIASATAEDYARTIRTVAACEDVDALIAIFIPPLVTRARDVARALREAAATLPRAIPMLTVFMSAQGIPDELRSEDVRLPSYAFPEDAARALGRAVAYGVWRDTPEGNPRAFDDVRPADATALIGAAVAGGGRWLRLDEVEHLLACYGIPQVPSRLVATPEEARAAAARLGERVAIKAIAPGVLHKTEAGAVAIGVPAGEAQDVAARMAQRLEEAGAAPEGFVVQRMADPGVEMLVGVADDPVFGPVVACGLGGTAVELMKDVAVRLTPLTDRDASEMLRSLRTYPLLTGFRGAPPADVAALEDVLLRVSTLVEAHPEVVEMDCNPVIVQRDGAVVVDARIRLEPATPRPPIAARRTI